MKKRAIALLLILITLLITVGVASANNGTQEVIDHKLGQQNQDILDMLRERSRNSSGDKFDELLNKYDVTKTSYKEFDLKKIKANISNAIFRASITSRGFVIPGYILLIMLFFLLLSTMGAKSLQKRKKYIILIIGTTVLFFLILNCPLIIIYFKHTPISEALSSGALYKTMFSIIFYLRDNSIAFAVILIVFGALNRILGKDDIPRWLLGGYLIKFAFAQLIVLQLLPPVITLII